MAVIDVHAHCVPAECLSLVNERAEAGNFIGDMTDIDRRLADMDRMGVDIQIMSAWQGFFNQSLLIARQFNDALAAYAARHPDRLRTMAVVPFAEPDEAADELERAVTELGCVGVEIGSNAAGVEVDDERYRPFWRKASKLGVPVFIHPTNPLGKERLKRFELMNILGFVTDTAVAAAALAFGGVLNELPDLKVLLAHGGGSMPFLRGRWAHGAASRLGLGASEVEALLRRFHVDSIVHGADSLRFVVEWAGADRVMLGSDYPYNMGFADPVRPIETARLSNEEKHGILGANAARLFNLEAG